MNPYYDYMNYMAAGGTSRKSANMQSQKRDMNSLAQEVMQALQQDMPPEEIFKALLKEGVDKQTATTVIQGVMEQMQAAQQQAPAQGQQMDPRMQQQMMAQQAAMQGQPPMQRYGGSYAGGGSTYSGNTWFGQGGINPYTYNDPYSTMMAMGGYIPYAEGGMEVPPRPQSQDFLSYEEFKAADDAWSASYGDQAPPQVDESMIPEEAVASQAAAPVQQAAPTQQLQDYKGVSIVDFLRKQGKANDYASRKALAQKLGIVGYTGKASENTQLMHQIMNNPNLIQDYQNQTYAPITTTPRSTAARTKIGSKTTRNRDGSQATNQTVAATDNSGGFLNYKPNPAFADIYASNNNTNAVLKSSNTPVNKNAPGYGQKGDAYADGLIDRSVKNKAMTDYSNQQYFNEEVGKLVGKVGLQGLLGGVGGNVFKGYGMASETLTPYFANQIPYVTAAARYAGRAIPYATKAIGYAMGGPTTEYPGYFNQQSPMMYGGDMAYGGGMNNGMMSYDNQYAAGGGIHIKPSKRGTFTAAATKHGKSVQGYASQVLANKGNYSPAMVKKANFAKNAAKWKHADGGLVEGQVLDATPELLQELKRGGYTFEYVNQ